MAVSGIMQEIKEDRYTYRLIGIIICNRNPSGHDDKDEAQIAYHEIITGFNNNLDCNPFRLHNINNRMCRG